MVAYILDNLVDILHLSLALSWGLWEVWVFLLIIALWGNLNVGFVELDFAHLSKLCSVRQTRQERVDQVSREISPRAMLQRGIEAIGYLQRGRLLHPKRDRVGLLRK